MKPTQTALPRLCLLAGMTVLFPSLTWAAPVPGNPAVNSSASFTLLSAEPGAGGGRAASASGTITASLSFGDAVAGGVSNVTSGGNQAKGGYTGQLYDGVSMALAAAPGTSVNEGDSVRLSALVTMDDGTTVADAAAHWSVISGPIASISSSGLASAGNTAVASAATVRGIFDTLSEDLVLQVQPLPYSPHPFTWEEEGEGGPFRIFLGTDSGTLVEIGSSSENHFNPGQLDMGTEYWWQVLDAADNDLTPGGGPSSFLTDLFQPDTRVGKSAVATTHIGNDLYNQSGLSQTGSLKLKGKKSGSIYFSIENDGNVVDEHRLLATKPSSKVGKISYIDLTSEGGNVTAAAITTGFAAGPVAPGEVNTYRILAKSKGKKKANQSLYVRAQSDLDSRGIDAGLGKITAIPVKKKKKKRKR